MSATCQPLWGSLNQRHVAMITLWIGVADGAGWAGGAQRSLADEIVQTVRYPSLAFLRRVLVDQGCSGA